MRSAYSNPLYTEHRAGAPELKEELPMSIFKNKRVPLKITDLNPELFSARENAAFLAGYEACAALCGTITSPDRDRLAFAKLTGAELSETDREDLRVFVSQSFIRLIARRDSDRRRGIALEIELPEPLPPTEGGGNVS